MTSPDATRWRTHLPEALPVAVDRWQRLEDERRFRVQQLADLEAETPASPRHESVRRMLSASACVALAEIDAALARMAEGRYGQCVTCGRQLDDERLDVLPMASLCMSCHYNEQNCRLAALSGARRG